MPTPTDSPTKLRSASAFPSLYNPPLSYSGLSFSGSFNFAPFRQARATSSFAMASPILVKVNASSTVGELNNEYEASSTKKVGADDLLIVGPGVLGRIVAEKWREEHPGCQIYGQTLTTDHHDELIKMGISPFLKWGTQVASKFSQVIFLLLHMEPPIIRVKSGVLSNMHK
ncbi:NAD(P)-binding Rossmann-fold superfamily protein [Striga hermonthica]|uniref:NAD(P)-binding Rossmann-fold superfamily protein n=1 Tax=Striga hermonthica TaxID=68872 RepID=A0A9N7RBX2_STRHE|nr:NAD(P)-binding Rossmann-fold superfamily protein [Striga hermonthica]